MDNFKTLTKIMSALRKKSHEIIDQALPFMELVSHNEYVATLIEKFPSLQPDDAQNTLQDVCLEWVEDADKIRQEIYLFIIETEDGFRINTEGCPFLSEVWNGDAYDKQGIEGMRMLLADLAIQQQNINEESLLAKATEWLMGEEDE